MLLNLHYEEQKHFEKLYKKLVRNIQTGKTTEKHNWIIFNSSNPQRKFLVAAFPYLNTTISERNMMMESIFNDSDAGEVKGAVIIAVNLEKKHYPYSALGGKLSSVLFDPIFSNMTSFI